jgi:hypothetical protein
LSSVFILTNLGQIAPNVPAVYDVLPARIRALRSKDQGWQNVGGVERGRHSRPSETEPRSRRRRRSIYRPVIRRTARALYFLLNYSVIYIFHNII